MYRNIILSWYTGFINWLKFLQLYVVIILRAQTSVLPWSKWIASICLCHFSNILRHNAGNKQCKIATHKTYRTYVYAHDELPLGSRSSVLYSLYTARPYVSLATFSLLSTRFETYPKNMAVIRLLLSRIFLRSILSLNSGTSWPERVRQCVGLRLNTGKECSP